MKALLTKGNEHMREALKYLQAGAIVPVDMETTILLVNALKEALGKEPDFGLQPDMHFGMNQDDWKDIVAAISKARDSRGIYLGCRPADVFQDWFLAMGLFKPKEKV
jgi:hypothetical protein